MRRRGVSAELLEDLKTMRRMEVEARAAYAAEEARQNTLAARAEIQRIRDRAHTVNERTTQLRRLNAQQEQELNEGLNR